MINMTVRQMRTLVAIRKCGKISAAARDIGLTSPAVTLQIQQLEQEVGSQLFLRTKAGVIATPTGEIVTDFARKILDEFSLLAETLDAHKGIKAGLIRLGVVSTGKYFAPRIIAAFNAQYPGVRIDLLTANRKHIIEKLHDHDIDVALMGRPPTHFDVRATLFGDHPLVFIGSQHHPLANKSGITRQELRECSFILRERGSGTRSSFEFFMAEIAGPVDVKSTEMDSNETIKQAVIAGLGLAFISGHTIEQEYKSGLLKILDVEDTPIRRQWFSVRHAKRSPSPAILAFEDFLRIRGPSLLPIIGKTYPASGPASGPAAE